MILSKIIDYYHSEFCLIRNTNEQLNYQNLENVKLKKWIPDAVVRKCSVKKVFLKFSQNSQENTCGALGLQLY